jgi:hypothetical protein
MKRRPSARARHPDDHDVLRLSPNELPATGIQSL